VSDATERARALLARERGHYAPEVELRRVLAEILAELSEAQGRVVLLEEGNAHLRMEVQPWVDSAISVQAFAMRWKAVAKRLFRCRVALLNVRGNLSDQAERIRGLEASDAYSRQETAAVRRVLLADVNERDRKIVALETACQEAMRKADDHRRQRDEARYACKAAEGSAEFLHEQLQAAQAEIAQLKQDLAETTAHAIDCEKSCEELVAEKAELQRSYEALHHEAAADARLAAADRAELAQLKQPAHVLGEAERLLREREVFTVLLTDIVAPGAATRHETQLRARKSHRDTSASTLAEAYAALAGGRDV
jgi:chromosome segregation ATPase